MRIILQCHVKPLKISAAVLMFVLGFSFAAKAQGTFNSNTVTGNWNAAGSWTLVGGIDGDGIPDSDDAVTIRSGHTITVNVASAASSLTLESAGGNKTLALSANLTVGGNVLIAEPSTNNTTAQITVGSNILNIGGSLTINGGNNGSNIRRGILSVSTGTVNLTGLITSAANANAQIIFSGSGIFNISGNWSFSATSTFTKSTSTVNLTGTTQSITTATSFNNLTIKTGSTTTSTAATAATGTFTIEATSKYIQQAGSVVPGATKSFNAASTYEWQTGGGGSFPSVAGITFGNLIINTASGNNSAGGNLTSILGNLIITNTTGGSYRLAATTSPTINIGGNIQINAGLLNFSSGTGAPVINVTGDIVLNGGTLQPAISTGVPTFFVAGNWTNNGATFTPGNGTVTFNAATADQTINKPGGETFNGLTVNKSTSGNVVLANNVTVNSGLTLTNGILDINGNSLTLNGTVSRTAGTISASSSTVTFSGTSSQNIPASTFISNAIANLNVSNGTGVTFNSSAAISGTMTVNGLFIPVAAAVISGAGTVTGSGIIQVTHSTGSNNLSSQYTLTRTLTNLTVEYSGAAVQSPDIITYSGLKISNSSGVNLNGSVATTTLNLNTGILSIGSNTLTINGAVSRTSGSLAGSNTSNLTIGGTAGSLFFDNTGTNNFLKNFTLNTGATATLGNALNITAYDGTSSEGVLTVTGTAVLTTGGFLAIKSNANGTARIAAGNTAGGYISGAVSVERFIPQNSSKAWRLLASTTSGQSINAAWQEGVVGGMVNPNPGFGTKIKAGNSLTTNLPTAQAAGFDSLSLGVSLFRYNSNTDVLSAVPTTNTGNIASEQGYFLFIRGDRSPGQSGAGAPTTSTVLRSRGTLFLGDQAAVATGASNYGLVRNPYPSRIDMRNIVRGSNLIDAYQVWDAKLGGAYGVGAFQTFTKSGADYVVSPGGGSYGLNGSVQNFIESGAAFFIQSTSNTNNTAQVTEACKTTASSNNSYRPFGVLADDKRITFSLYAINPNSTDAVDGGLVFFNDAYSNDVDIQDVRKSGNFSENFGILRNNTDLVVERRKDVLLTDSIFFKMYQMRQISYRLDLENTGFDPAVTTVILQDKYTGTNTTLDLLAMTSYTFTVSGVAGSAATDRFRLILASSNTFSGTGNWTENARWSRGVPPVSGEGVIIAAGANATLNTDFTVAGSLTMSPTSTLVVNPTKTLSVTGTANLAGQSVTFKSDNTGYGSLGQITGTLNGATNVTVERYIPNNGFRSWRLLSVPTYASGQTIRQVWQEGTVNPLPLQNNLANYGTQITGVFGTQGAAAAAGFDSTSVQASMLRWNGTSWSNITNTNAPIADNKAYFLFVRGERSKGVTGAITNSSATTLRTNGTVYTGNQAFSVPTGSFSLVANTYPSAINFTGLTRSNVNNLFYIWDSKKQNGNSLGVYQTFSNTNSFNCLISGGSYTLGQPNTIIESGQAFFVTGGSVLGGGSITLLESAKVSSVNGNSGFRPSAVPAKIDSRLLDENSNVLDANVVVFDRAYSRVVDTDDAVKFGNPGANFAVETGSKILAIEGTQPIADKDVIQFRMWNLKQQDYKLQFVAGNMNVQDLYATLEDSYLNTIEEVDLKAVTNIGFTVDGNPASSAANRFRIVFSKNKPAAISVKQGYTIAPNPVQGKSINVLFKNQIAGKYYVKIVDVNGKMIAVKVITHPGSNSNHVIALPSATSGGSYQLEIIAPDNTKTVKQLLVNSVQ